MISLFGKIDILSDHKHTMCPYRLLLLTFYIDSTILEITHSFNTAWMSNVLVHPLRRRCHIKYIRGLGNIKNNIKIQKVWIRYTPPTHPSIQNKFRKISKVINHEYLYIEARTFITLLTFECSPKNVIK